MDEFVYFEGVYITRKQYEEWYESLYGKDEAE